MCGLVATSDERAVFADGSSKCWIIDPNYPEGYTQLRFPTIVFHLSLQSDNFSVVALTHISKGIKRSARVYPGLTTMLTIKAPQNVPMMKK